jgi:hypothetical protein
VHYRACCAPPAAAPSARRCRTRRLLPLQVDGAAARQPSLQAQHAAGRPRRPLLQRLDGDMQRLVALARPVECRRRLQQTPKTVLKHIAQFNAHRHTLQHTAHVSSGLQRQLIWCLHGLLC